MTDLSIYQDLLAGGQAHDRALSLLFRHDTYREGVLATIRSKGLNQAEAYELWTEVVIEFGSLVRRKKYQESGTMLAFLKNIARFKALNYLRDRRSKEKLGLEDYQLENLTIKEEDLGSLELAQIIDGMLGRLGETCKSVLSLWSRGYSMKEIQEQLKLISEAATRKRKHNCMKKLLSNVEESKEMQDLLKLHYFDQ